MAQIASEGLRYCHLSQTKWIQIGKGNKQEDQSKRQERRSQNFSLLSQICSKPSSRKCASRGSSKRILHAFCIFCPFFLLFVCVFLHLFFTFNCVVSIFALCFLLTKICKMPKTPKFLVSGENRGIVRVKKLSSENPEIARQKK